MGYAQLAGLPPVTGLYATLIPLVVYFLLGPSRILIISPDSAVCPLVAAAIIPLAGGDASERVALAGLLALMTGLIMIAGGLGRFGFVTDLLSMPVRVGYLAGIALTVIVSQLPKLFGYSVHAEDFIHGLTDFIDQLDETNATALAVGVGCLAVIVILRLISPGLPGVLIAVVAATVLVGAAGLDDELPVVGVVPSGLPDFAVPDVTLDDLTTLSAPRPGSRSCPSPTPACCHGPTPPGWMSASIRTGSSRSSGSPTSPPALSRVPGVLQRFADRGCG